VRAVVYREFGQPLAIEDMPDPEAPADGVVVRVEATGLCRSDWHGWHGHDADIVPPHVPGHEFAGTIARVGADVRRWRGGERVTVAFVGSCGRCASCLAGEAQVCDDQRQPGFHYRGSFADQVAVERADINVVALPDELDMVTAASLGCRFGTAYRAVTMQGAAAPGKWVAIHGCGGVGLSAVMIAAAAGARVIAVDVSAAALRAAAGAGAELAVPAGTDLREPSGGGVDLSLDAIGSEAACAASIAGLRKGGRHVQVGLLPEPPRIPMDLVIARELEVLGAHGMAAHAYPEMLALVAAGRLRPDRLVTAAIALDDAPAALMAMTDGSPAGITVIRP
jgi:D-arabinose 1-dehydrogenase-like Zn-dependent alcohol dehydrogenase